MIFFFQGSGWAFSGTLQGSHIGNLNFGEIKHQSLRSTMPTKSLPAVSNESQKKHSFEAVKKAVFDHNRIKDLW